MSVGLTLFTGAVVVLVALRFWNAAARRQGVLTITNGGDPRFLISVVVSGVVLLTAIYIILSKEYGVESEKWAFGAVGTIVGYWLKA